MVAIEVTAVKITVDPSMGNPKQKAPTTLQRACAWVQCSGAGGQQQWQQ